MVELLVIATFTVIFLGMLKIAFTVVGTIILVIVLIVLVSLIVEQVRSIVRHIKGG